MSQDNESSTGPLLLSFLAGAAIGALVVTFTTPKSGPDLRVSLKHLGRHARGRASDLTENARAAWDETKSRAASAAADLKRGVTDSVDDLRGKPPVSANAERV